MYVCINIYIYTHTYIQFLFNLLQMHVIKMLQLITVGFNYAINLLEFNFNDT